MRRNGFIFATRELSRFRSQTGSRNLYLTSFASPKNTDTCDKAFLRLKYILNPEMHLIQRSGE